jgi:hypothetical protein
MGCDRHEKKAVLISKLERGSVAKTEETIAMSIRYSLHIYVCPGISPDWPSKACLNQETAS